MNERVPTQPMAADITGKGRPLQDFIGYMLDAISPGITERIDLESLVDNTWKDLTSNLTERQARVLKLRLGLDGEFLSLRRTAQILCVSASTVARDEKRALDKLSISRQS